MRVKEIIFSLKYYFLSLFFNVWVKYLTGMN